MSLFRKRRRKDSKKKGKSVRRASALSSGDEADEPGRGAVAPAAIAAARMDAGHSDGTSNSTMPDTEAKTKVKKKKKKKKGSKATAMGVNLSFQEDVDDDVDLSFSIKKSKASRHLARAVRRGEPITTDDAAGPTAQPKDNPRQPQSTGGAYSQAALRELREQQNNMNAKSLRVKQQAEDQEPPQKRERTVASVGSSGVRAAMSSNADPLVGADDDEAMFDKEQLEQVRRDKARRRASLMLDTAAKSSLRPQDLRPKFLQPDTGLKRVSSSSQGAGGQTSAEAEWELQQIRRATGDSKHASSTASVRAGAHGKTGKARSLPSEDTTSKPRFLGISEVRSLIQTQIADLQHYEKQDAQKDRKLVESIGTMEEEVQRLEQNVKKDSDTYVLYQEMQHYVRNLCACAEDKRDKISDLCAAVHRARRRVADERSRTGEATFAALIRSLRAQGLHFDVVGAYRPTRSAAHVFLLLTPRRSITVAGNASLQDETNSNVGAGVDEFGRDLTRVRSQRDAKVLQEWKEQVAGAAQSWWNLDTISGADSRDSQQSSTPSATSSSTGLLHQELELLTQIAGGDVSFAQGDDAYHERIAELSALRELVVADASDEFYKFPLILSAFEKWRQQHRASFDQTFADMGLAELLAPYAQLEMAAWDPLLLGSAEPPRARLDFEWLSELDKYVKERQSSVPEGTDKKTKQNTAKRLLSDVLERSAVVLLLPMITDLWVPSHTRQSNALRLCIEELIERGISAKFVGKLKDALARRVQTFLRNLQLLVPKATKINAGDAQALAGKSSTNAFAFYFASSLVTLNNICRIHKILPSASLRSSVWSSLISKQLWFIVQSLSVAHERAENAFADGPGAEDDAAFAALEACVKCCRTFFRALSSEWLEDRSLLQGLFAARGTLFEPMRPLVKNAQALSNLLQRMSSEGVYAARHSRSPEFGGLQRDVARFGFFLSQATGGAS